MRDEEIMKAYLKDRHYDVPYELFEDYKNRMCNTLGFRLFKLKYLFKKMIGL